jgi:hypothetical protein
MQASELYVGARVRHYRGEYEGTVLRVVEQPEPAPLHVDVRTEDLRVLTVPLNQLNLVEDIPFGRPSVPPSP